MKEAIKSLVVNEKLLNILVSIFFSQTNFYDSEQVVECFELIEMVLNHLNDLNRDICS